MAKMNPLNTVTRKCSSDFASKQPKTCQNITKVKKTNVSGPELCTKINKKNTPPFSLWCAKQEIDTTSVESNAHEGKTWERKQGK